MNEYMNWLKNCKITMTKGSFYNGMKLTKDVEVINGEPYIGGVKQSWEEVTEQKDYKQRIVDRSFTNIRNMTIQDGRTIIDGIPIEEWNNRNEILVVNITINGDIDSLDVDSCDTITINGNAANVNTKNGNVRVSGNIEGNAESKNGNITANTIKGNAETKNGNICRF